MDKAFDMLAGGVNYGERITFFGCTFNASPAGVNIDNYAVILE